MARDFAKSFYNSKAWKSLADYYRSFRLGICERCGAPNSRQVHHKISLTPYNITDPDVALGEDNLELLCSVCHQLEHNQKNSAVVAGLMFCKETGKLIKTPPCSGGIPLR